MTEQDESLAALERLVEWDGDQHCTHDCSCTHGLPAWFDPAAIRAALTAPDARVAELEALRSGIIGLRDDFLSYGEDESGPHPMVDRLNGILARAQTARTRVTPFGNRRTS